MRAQSGLIGRHSPVSARRCPDPALLPCSKALRSLPAAALPEEAPAPSTAGSRPAGNDAACLPFAAATGLRCSPVMPSASWAVGAVSTCSSVLLCSPSALHLYTSGRAGRYAIMFTGHADALQGQYHLPLCGACGKALLTWLAAVGMRCWSSRQYKGCSLVPNPLTMQVHKVEPGKVKLSQDGG